MKIIKNGKISKTTERFTCPNCGCVFECEISECNVIFDRQDGDYIDAVCPTCGKKVYKDFLI